MCGVLPDTRRLKVVDASVIVELVVHDLEPERLGDEELAVPCLIDSEVINVVRRLVAQRVLTDQQGTDAFDGFTRLANTPGINCRIGLL